MTSPSRSIPVTDPAPLSDWFLVAASFAAPFVSDSSTHYVQAATPAAALEQLAQVYRHPCGLYAAQAYRSADAFHKGEKYLARWLSNHARAIEEAKATVYRSDGPGELTLDGIRHPVQDPKAGAVVS